MTRYWYDIMRGVGWEDIVVKHKITEHRTKHRIRELVLAYADKTRPERPFRIKEWRRVSGYAAKWKTKRRDRPPKRLRRYFGPDAWKGKAGRDACHDDPSVPGM